MAVRAVPLRQSGRSALVRYLEEGLHREVSQNRGTFKGVVIEDI